ncbi:chemotaxis protein CheB [Sphingobacteriaceae bacterium]|nr:chemotaxis protein CheB [Sphingobacteriaceae bacterium]
MLNNRQAVVIGGSAGSIPVLNTIIAALPKLFPLPVIVCVHRMKNVAEGIKEVFELNANCALFEPNDKEPILPGNIYIAPSNYHLLIGSDKTFSLSTDRLVNYSRPAIDLTFQTAAKVYKSGLIGILLTGANKDGAHGMLAVKNNGGTTIVQDPEECSAPFMPAAALALKCVDYIFTERKIISFLLEK